MSCRASCSATRLPSSLQRAVVRPQTRARRRGTTRRPPTSQPCSAQRPNPRGEANAGLQRATRATRAAATRTGAALPGRSVATDARAERGRSRSRRTRHRVRKLHRRTETRAPTAASTCPALAPIQTLAWSHVVTRRPRHGSWAHLDRVAHLLAPDEVGDGLGAEDPRGPRRNTRLEGSSRHSSYGAAFAVRARHEGRPSHGGVRRSRLHLRRRRKSLPAPRTTLSSSSAAKSPRPGHATSRASGGRSARSRNGSNPLSTCQRMAVTRAGCRHTVVGHEVHLGRWLAPRAAVWDGVGARLGRAHERATAPTAVAPFPSFAALRRARETLGVQQVEHELEDDGRGLVPWREAHVGLAPAAGP